MQHPLDGARLKVIRAQEHVDSLKAEIGMYLKERPYDIDTKKKADGTFSTTVRIRIAPPLRLSTIVGDCLTNARAALDYTMFQLAHITFDPPFDVTDRNDRNVVSFPLFEKPETDPNTAYVNRFNALANRMIAIPTAADAIDRIKASQPYNAGQGPLGWLHELVNSDKHRMPSLTIGLIDTFGAVFSNAKVWFEGAGGTVFGEQEILAGNFTVDVRNLTTERVTIQSDAMYVDTQVTTYVALQDVTMPREPVERTLEQIIETVANVIPRFETFFP